MAKEVKLSKEDQQLEDAGQAVISVIKGLIKGVKALRKDPSKLVILIIITLICGVIFYLRENIIHHFLPGVEGFHVLKIMLLLAPTIPFITLYLIGEEDKESQDEYEKKFAEINFCSKTKAFPRFLNKEIKDKEVIYSFYSVGLDQDDWKSYKSKLEQAFDCRIIRIAYAPKTRQIIMIHTVPATFELSTNLQWSNDYIREKDFEIVLGVALLEDVVVDLNKTPHALIASVTGGGKSVLMRCILWQCIKKGARPYMIDFKGGVEFGTEYEQYGEVVTERQEALEMLQELTKENSLRLKLFRKVGVKNIIEYNEKFPDDTLCRIVLFSDEVAEMLDKSGLQSSEKKIYYAIEKKLSTVARLGRAAGINMIHATQRPDANVIVGQIKNNLPIRISGRMTDDPASKMVLNNTEATKIDAKALGRFMYNVGADTHEFQGYNFTENSLEKGDFQRGKMLIDDPDCKKDDISQKDFEKMQGADFDEFADDDFFEFADDEFIGF